MLTMALWFMAKVYMEGVVATIQQHPIFFSEIQCRAQLEKTAIKSPDDAAAAAFVRKRVYERLIVDYHKLQDGKSARKNLCDAVRGEAKLVEKWLARQRSVWGSKSEESLKSLFQTLERDYDVSWR